MLGCTEKWPLEKWYMGTYPGVGTCPGHNGNYNVTNDKIIYHGLVINSNCQVWASWQPKQYHISLNLSIKYLKVMDSPVNPFAHVVPTNELWTYSVLATPSDGRLQLQFELCVRYGMFLLHSNIDITGLSNSMAMDSPPCPSAWWTPISVSLWPPCLYSWPYSSDQSQVFRTCCSLGEDTDYITFHCSGKLFHTIIK